jgi:sporulation protein YlmC with PRC-barrel domain
MTASFPTRFVRSGLLALLFGLASFGAAAQPAGAASGPARSASSPVVTVPVAGRAVLGVTVAETEVLATGWRASKLLKVDVYNDRNEKIGKVDDLVIAPDGTLTAAVVNVGSFLGMAKHLVAIPVKHFKQIAPKAILPNASKDQLKALPKFEYTS